MCVQVIVIVFYCCVSELTMHALHSSSPQPKDGTLLHIAKASLVPVVMTFLV